MIIPVQITFRNMKPSEAVEVRVRDEVAKLETFCKEIMHCHVVVELPHRHHQRGDLFHVRIDMTLPGAELVVKRKPSLHSGLRHAELEKESKRFEAQASHKDAFVVIRDAFKEARRQLQDYSRRVRGQTKVHVPQPSGRVSKLFPDEDYGFLATPDGSEVYFHKNSVLDDAFNRLTIGARVTFSEELGEKGVQASTVKAIG